MGRSICTVFFNILECILVKVPKSVYRAAGFKNERPHGFIVILALLFLFVFLLASLFAITFPAPATKLAVTIVNGSLAVLLLALFLFDVFLIDRRMRQRRPYKRNLANTVFTVLLTMVTMTALYRSRWYDALNRDAIQLLSHNAVSPRFPSIVFLQRNVHSMAVLRDGPLKCFLGDWIDHAPLCTGLTSQEVLNSPSCDCSDRWPTLEDLERGENTVLWLGQNTTYYSMVPSESMVSKGAGHILTLQIFFSYNSSEALANASVTESPGVFMAVFDPSYDLQDMISEGFLQVARIDANSGTNVNVGLTYYEYLNRAPLYRYDFTTYNRPNLDLVCDVTKDTWYPCHLHLDVEIPIHIQTVVRQVKSLSWSALVAEAGAYFALIQFLSWLLSGQAWAL